MIVGMIVGMDRRRNLRLADTAGAMIAEAADQAGSIVGSMDRRDAAMIVHAGTGRLRVDSMGHRRADLTDRETGLRNAGLTDRHRVDLMDPARGRHRVGLTDHRRADLMDHGMGHRNAGLMDRRRAGSMGHHVDLTDLVTGRRRVVSMGHHHAGLTGRRAGRGRADSIRVGVRLFVVDSSRPNQGQIAPDERR